MDDRNPPAGDNIIEIIAARCTCVNKKCLIEVCSCYFLGEKCSEYCPCEQDCWNKLYYDFLPNREEIMENFIGEGSRTTQENHSNNNNNNTRSSEAGGGFSRGCKCTTSRCMIQACGCFGVREFCTTKCRCQRCINNVENKDKVEQARNERDTKGCRCTGDVHCTDSSKCWCSGGKKPCIKACRCKGCLNIYGRKPQRISLFSMSEESKAGSSNK
ncbi:hypothetical protein ABFX02_01G032100 [Erythranthe guttata]